MTSKIAKPVLYVLIGSACVYASLWIGVFVQAPMGEESFGFIINGLLGICTIGLTVLLFAAAATLLWMLLAGLYTLGEWIMEKLL